MWTFWENAKIWYLYQKWQSKGNKLFSVIYMKFPSLVITLAENWVCPILVVTVVHVLYHRP